MPSTSSISGIALVSGPPTSGAAFELNRAAESDAHLSFDGGWTLDTRSGESIVVVRGCDLRDFRPLFAALPSAASRGLDLPCMSGGPTYALSRATEEGIYFWPNGESLQVHWYSTIRIVVSARASLTVGGSPQPAPLLRFDHHPSFAHFRRSQIETDLGDSYRHAYLALESLLDSIRPQDNEEPEGVWLLAALIEANKLAPGQPKPPHEAAPEQYAEWYDSERNHLFHSKSSRNARQAALTGRQVDELVRKKNKLLSFYMSVAQAHLGTLNLSGGGLTYTGFDMTVLERYSTGRFMARVEEDGEPAKETGEGRLLRGLHGEPNGEGYFLCRNLPLPSSRTVTRWSSSLDNDRCTYTDFESAALTVDDDDRLSVGLRLVSGTTNFTQRFLS